MINLQIIGTKKQTINKRITTTNFHQNDKKQIDKRISLFQKKSKTTTVNNHNKIIKNEPTKIQIKPQQKQVQQLVVGTEKQEVKLAQKTIVQQQQPEIIVNQFEVMDKFITQNEVLKFSTVEEKYGFGLVFKGNYLPILKQYKNKEIVQPKENATALQYTWQVRQQQVYELTIQQDQEQESKYEKKVYKAPIEAKCPLKVNRKVKQLSEQMQRMEVSELGKQHHRELIEQRDLEDILYG